MHVCRVGAALHAILTHVCGLFADLLRGESLSLLNFVAGREVVLGRGWYLGA
jgi:hypothetical protein